MLCCALGAESLLQNHLPIEPEGVFNDGVHVYRIYRPGENTPVEEKSVTDRKLLDLHPPYNTRANAQFSVQIWSSTVLKHCDGFDISSSPASEGPS